MKHASNEATSASGSYRETFRSHRILCLLPIVVGMLAAVAVLMTAASKYQSTASIWVDTAAPVASSVGADGSPSLAEPPASSEQGILTELLTTDSFAESVVTHSMLGATVKGASATRAAARNLVEGGRVTAVATGNQVLDISYTGSSPAIAQSVLGAVVSQLQGYNASFAAQHAHAASAFDGEQLKLARAALKQANDNVDTYRAQNPDATNSTPGLASLLTIRNNAVTEVGQDTATLDQATGSPSADAWSIRVLDAAGPAVSQAAGKKKILGVLIGGAFAGVLVSLLAIIALTPARRRPDDDSDELDDRAPGIVPVPEPLSGVPDLAAHRALVEASRRFAGLGPLSEQMDDA